MNLRKGKKTITKSPASKRRSMKNGMPEGVAARATSENPGSAKVASFPPSNDTPTPAKVAVSISSGFLAPGKAALLASNDGFTPVEIVPSASNGNATLGEVARPVLSSSNALEEVAPNVRREDPTFAPTCSEEPHLFSGLDYVDALLSLADAPEATHSGIIRPCKNASAHPNEPFHVCLDCRNRATRHIANTTPKLLRRDFLPMCTDCGNKAVSWIAERSITHEYQSGCHCAVEWLCWQCKTEAYELANARKDAERKWRSAINVVEKCGDKVTHCKFGVTECICGRKIVGKSSVYRCAGCKGFWILPVKR